MRADRAHGWVRSGVLAGCGLLVLVVSAASPAAGAAASLSTVVIPDVGPGYAVSSQGPLDPARFAANWPDPAAAKGVLSMLAKSSSTYERVWQADGGLNQVQDLLLQFPSAVGTQVFFRSAQHSLESGEIVSSDPLPFIPGSRRVTYFAATNHEGVGEAITMRAGTYVDLVSFFSAASGNAQPIAPANAERVAQAQYAAMVAAPGGASAREGARTKGVSAGTVGLAVVVVAILAVAVATPALLRRRRLASDADTTVARHATGSDADAVDDLSDHSG